MSFFVSKNGSLKKSESGTSNVSPFDASTSDARSPPFKQIRPFGSLLRDFGEMLRLAKGESASRRITARLTTKSNLRWHSPASPCWNVTFASPMARATSWATLIFLPMRSMRWNLHYYRERNAGKSTSTPEVENLSLLCWCDEPGNGEAVEDMVRV